MKTITVKFQIPGWHNWPNAPKKYEYLKNKHRHVFYFEAEIAITKEDREIEFIDLKSNINNLLCDEYGCFSPKSGFVGCDFGKYSCETIASATKHHLQGILKNKIVRVSVFEDNENGATVYE